MKSKICKYLPLLVCIALFLFPFLMFGAEVSKEEAEKLIAFKNGDGTLESWFMEIFTRLDVKIDAMATSASKLGRAIGGIGAMIVMGVMGWRMQNGEADWSIEPLIKPFIIGFILIYWTGFCNLIQYPFQKLATPSENVFKEIEKEADDKRTLRFIKQLQVLDATIKFKSDVESKKREAEASQNKGLLDGVVNGVTDAWSKLTMPLYELGEKMNYYFQKQFGEVVEMVALMILRVCVYLIFFIQKIWAYILIVLGPIAVGISLVPGFENSIYNWISKFININLYTFIAYTIINIGQQLIMAGYDMDIQRLSAIVNDKGQVINEHLLINYTTYGGMLNSAIFPCVGYLVTAVAILMTPTIADTIVTAGGAGVMTKAKQATNKTASVGKSAGQKVVNAGVNVGRAMAGDATVAASNIKNSIGTMRGK